MSLPKTKELRSLGSADMASKLAELRTELAKERGHIASGTRPDNPGRIRAVRKTIARILTLEHEKKSKQKKEQEVPKKK